MKVLIASTIAVVRIGLMVFVVCSAQPALAGPNGGGLVPIQGVSAYNELLANPDTGEVMVHTWDDHQAVQAVARDHVGSNGTARAHGNESGTWYRSAWADASVGAGVTGITRTRTLG